MLLPDWSGVCIIEILWPPHQSGGCRSTKNQAATWLIRQTTDQDPGLWEVYIWHTIETIWHNHETIWHVLKTIWYFPNTIWQVQETIWQVPKTFSHIHKNIWHCPDTVPSSTFAKTFDMLPRPYDIFWRPYDKLPTPSVTFQRPSDILPDTVPRISDMFPRPSYTLTRRSDLFRKEQGKKVSQYVWNLITPLARKSPNTSRKCPHHLKFPNINKTKSSSKN